MAIYAEHFQLAKGRRGTERFAFPGDRHSSAQVVTLAGRVGITGRFSTTVLAQFNRRERSDVTVAGNRVSREHTGFGDVSVLGYFRLTPAISQQELTVGAGIKFATGESRAEDDTGELPEEVQPGTGANDLIFTSLYSHGFGRLSASAGFTWRLTGQLKKIDELPTGDTVKRKFEFGNEFIYALSMAWTPDDRWGFQLGFQGRHARPDRSTSLSPDGTTAGFDRLPSTGGERVWFAPTIRYAPAISRAGISFGLLIPVYENLLGSQLSTQPGLRLSLESKI